MDATFINPYHGGVGLNEATIEPPLGLAYIAAVLEEKGYHCEVVDANVHGLTPRQTVDCISTGTHLIGLYLNSFTFNAVKEAIRLVRVKHDGALVVVGGPLATASPQLVLNELGCDGVIRGEGEFGILRIMENLKDGRPGFDSMVGGGFYMKDNGEMVGNPVQRIEHLDKLPFPAYHLLPPLRTYRCRCRKRPVAAMITSRGCAYECIFCSKDVFRRKVTYRSAQNVLQEIDFLVSRYRVKQIDILDDNFMQRPERVHAILDGLVARDYDLALNLQSGIRAELADKDILAKMRRAGFYKLGFGIESADPEVLRMCRKHLSLKRVEEAVDVAKRLGFEVYGFFIIGLPGETDVSFRQTLEFARKLDLDVANFTLAIPFPGTELYRMVEQKGRFLVDTSRNIGQGFYGGKVFYEYENLRAQDVLKRFRDAYRAYYSFRKKASLLLKIRSMGELVWLWGAVRSFAKGALRI